MIKCLKKLIKNFNINNIKFFPAEEKSYGHFVKMEKKLKLKINENEEKKNYFRYFN